MLLVNVIISEVFITMVMRGRQMLFMVNSFGAAKVGHLNGRDVVDIGCLNAICKNKFTMRHVYLGA